MEKARAEAKAAGLPRFASEKPCKHGHTIRYVAGGACVQCVVLGASAWAKKNAAARKEIQARYDAKRPKKERPPKLRRAAIAIKDTPDDRATRPIYGIAYIITNSANGKKYIGITTERTVSRRWWRHQREAADGSSNPLHSAIRKYGADAFAAEIVACARTWTDLQAIERALIAQHSTFLGDGGHGYNATLGGEGGFGIVIPQESVAKRAAAHRGWKPTHEMLAKMRGRTVGEEGRRRIREAALRRAPVSDETRRKMRDTRRGRKHTEETKRKIRASHLARGRQ